MAVADSLAELAAALPALEQQLEGLNDFGRVNLSPAAMMEVGQAKAALGVRIDRIKSAAEALQSLLDGGYPDLPAETVDSAVLADLNGQIAGMVAAMGRFQPRNEAVAGTITFSAGG